MMAPAPSSVSRAPIRIPKPVEPAGPRRIGLQAGHWRTNEVPEALRRLEVQTGTSWGGYTEWQLNLDIANRVAAILRGRGYTVDIIPTLVPTNYLADAFVSLHADGDPAGAARGYKAAHGSRRGPYEDQLVRALLEEYGKATGLPEDFRISRNMLGYYAFSWSRFQWSAAPHTPAAILEMGFMTSAADRAVLLQRPNVVAEGVANGILRFLDEVPQSALFGEDLIVQPPQPRGAPQTAQPQVAAPAPSQG
jgi:N-acetylmuramoyl-L-alanine amidase